MISALLWQFADLGSPQSLPFRGDNNDADTGRSVEDAAPTPSATVEPDWRLAEYEKLRRLGGGLSRDHFRGVLGTPLFTTESFDGEFIQDLFQGPGYWVQAVSDTAGGVEFMSVTSCDGRFRPTLVTTMGIDITLNETRFRDLGDPMMATYRGLANTANRIFVEGYYTGNPGNYMTYYAGINDACSAGVGFPAEEECDSPALNVDVDRLSDPPGSDLALAAPEVVAFRNCATVNTYGEAGPFFNEDAVRAFQVGADRLLVRTVPEDAGPHPPTPSTSREPLATPAALLPAALPLYQIYQAGDGDTINSIGQRFGIDPQYLLASNPGVDGSFLVLGQSLVIPAANGLLHEVTFGETLADIATRYGVSVESIVSFAGNGLDSPGASLSETQIVFVPNAVIGTPTAVSR